MTILEIKTIFFFNINVQPIIYNNTLIVNAFLAFIIDLGKMTNLRDILAANLRKNRQKCGITQSKLAEKAEISTQYIAMIELSKQFPTPEVLERLAGALGIEAYELFAVSPSPESIMERLQKDIIREIREVIAEVLEKNLAEKRNNLETVD
ncbi:MAG: helix-turn-helix transcriptional regulator [Treponema sp.]|nr:helix-turn-helix transcriptional regulator [Treponema sp.]